MLLIICRWLWWSLGGLGFLALAFSIWGLRPRRRARCPGPPQRWWTLLNPLQWWPRNRCGYDLGAFVTGSPALCPECGGTIRWSRARRPLRSLRLLPVAVLLLATARSAYLETRARRDCYARALPTTALILVQRAMGPATPTQIRNELYGRSDPTSLAAWQVRLLIPVKIADLRDDDIRWNSYAARDWLSGVNRPALPALRRALRSDDYQQRQLAADILRRLDDLATPDLVRATIEGLRDDDLVRACVSNACDGFSWLLAHPELAEPELRAGLVSENAQERLICAAIAGHCRLTALLPAAIPILIDRLADNTVWDDASFATTALFSCGDAAIPYLEQSSESLEPQTRALSRHLLRNLTAPVPLARTVEPGPYADIVHQTNRALWDPIDRDPTDFTLSFYGLESSR